MATNDAPKTPAATAADPKDQQQNPADNGQVDELPEGETEGQTAETEVEVKDADLDPEDRALRDAQREADAEEKGEQPGEKKDEPQQQPDPKAAQQPKPPANQPPAKPQGKQQQNGKQRQPIMVPKARLDEALSRAEQATNEAALARAQLAAHAQQQQQEPQGPSVDDQIKTLREELYTAADDLDRATISQREYEKKRTEIDDKIAALRASQNAPQADAPADDGKFSYTDEILIETADAQLEQQHPGLNLVTDKDLQILTAQALYEAKALGEPIGTGAGETLRLHKLIAQKSDDFARRRYPNEWRAAQQQRRQGSQPTQPTGGTQPAGQQQQPKGLSPEARARLAKASMAGQMPPNPNTLGRGAPPSDGRLSESKILSMSEDDLASLKPEELESYLGNS